MLGTGPFAVPTLRALAATEHDVLLVVTRPPRGRQPSASPMQQAANALGLEVWSPESVNLPDSVARLCELQADLLVVCDYGEILRPEALATTRLGGVNLHGSLLPKYRGAAPVQWAILNGELVTGVTAIQMTPGLDAGPSLCQVPTRIDPDEDAAALENRLADMGAEMVVGVVDQLAAGTAKPVPQDISLATKAPRLKKEHGAIDWQLSAEEIKNLVRGVRPWPRAYTFWHRAAGQPLRLNVDRVDIVSPEEIEELGLALASAAPGTALPIDDRMLVTTGDDFVELQVVQPSGKRSMAAGDFLRGYRVQAGDRFGPESKAI
jgi:methionyl-tRNA formyltransferase